MTRNGHLPAKNVISEIGPINVRQTRVRDGLERESLNVFQLDMDRPCILVVIGVTEDGKKKLLEDP